MQAFGCVTWHAAPSLRVPTHYIFFSGRQYGKRGVRPFVNGRQCCVGDNSTSLCSQPFSGLMFPVV